MSFWLTMMIMDGIVIKASGGAYDVQIGNQCYTCTLRHHLIEAEKRHLNETKEMPHVDFVAVGIVFVSLPRLLQ